MHACSTTLWRYRVTLDVLVADHLDARILEVIFYNPSVDLESRLYIDKALLIERLPYQDLEAKILTLKESYIRQKKDLDFSREKAINEIKHDMIVQFILNRIHVVTSTQSSQEPAVDNIHADATDSFVVELKVNFGDILRADYDRENRKPCLDVVLPSPPQSLAPLRTNQRRRLS